MKAMQVVLTTIQLRFDSENKGGHLRKSFLKTLDESVGAELTLYSNE